MSPYKDENRKRLINLIESVEKERNPTGWRHVARVAVGGLLTIGFSRMQPHLLLVVSHTGRSVVDCSTGQKVERDYEAYAGLDDWYLSCVGIGVLKQETIRLCGPNGGGMPQSNSAGESLELVSPNWPEQDLVLCRDHKSVYVEGHQSSCSVIYSEHIRGFGFSWCGHYIAAACGSDVDMWQRVEKLES